ncbi:MULTISPECIES: TIR domain-containing protein [unclassified Mycolicibacterium]|uniref:TIR domain-containing protein n=1 Tax=unclassified Mycolicibacterium TaxID=2636767 RepID=UPI0012DDA24B|nr:MULTISPECIES: TIR domain-containing protein [unclassified Mycolicibacterium]MUL82017.1 TIR domain-containing protein [Mycolicibacterium sp. CBMA 329]MUL87783.1 TIR domain-containing protein [Mycolicibacterium sp. CBMA 331]MUM01607.1 TIR domain-containing protein [Mycolicibacterium sp. CBMA 334]MUM27269.1 TIR domain-containing protein [Mycolicibacterium sp. CBMA 295]MUM38080.1 TIR domain-containing protein [Mycolicibacterium sp. CBMA 247]
MSDMHNVFISHRHEDDALVAELKTLLEGRNVVIRDSSITSDNPNNATSESYIKSEVLAPNIRWAGKVIVIVTPDTKNHPWVDWEIDYAEKQGKDIIGVWAPNSQGCEVPESLEQHADSMVSWDANKIVDALNGERVWEESTGTPRLPQPLSRIGC